MDRLRIAIVLAFSGTLALTAAAGAQWSVVDLDPPLGTGLSEATSGFGDRTGGFLAEMLIARAVLWKRETSGAMSMIELHPPEAVASFIMAMSGEAQGGYVHVLPEMAMHASLWRGTPESWVDLAPPGYFHSVILGVSADQQVGRVRGMDNIDHAALWTGTAGSFVELHLPGFTLGSVALAVDGGRQVGYAAKVRGGRYVTEASLWRGSAASWESLNPPGAQSSFAYGISGDVQVGQAVFSDRSHAVMWAGTGWSWVDLNPPGVDGGAAMAAAPGIQVGTVFTGAGYDHASLWFGDAGSWVDLHALLPANFAWSTAEAVWRDGSTIFVAGRAVLDEAYGAHAVLWVYTAAPAASDFNGDGFLDFFDYDAFVGCFEGSGCPAGKTADFNGDGFADFADYADFVAAFEFGV